MVSPGMNSPLVLQIKKKKQKGAERRKGYLLLPEHFKDTSCHAAGAVGTR